MRKKSLLSNDLNIHNPKAITLVEEALERAERRGLDLPGIQDADTRRVFCMQIIESIRRVKFVRMLSERNLTPERSNPTNDLFDPLRAAVHLRAAGDTDEACWLAFLSTHFGRRPDTKWNLVKAFYRGDQHGRWSWRRTISETNVLLAWLDSNKESLRSAGRFGNHRKYESLDAYSKNGTGAALISYINWVMSFGGHQNLLRRALEEGDNNSELSFAWLYGEMKKVSRFGRMAKFDFLCMLDKLNLAPISPGSMFVSESTGPLRGSRVLFGSEKSASDIEDSVRILDKEMLVGMQVFEDAICNWQKSTHVFKAFRG